MIDLNCHLLYVWCDYYLVLIYFIYFILLMMACESRNKDLYEEEPWSTTSTEKSHGLLL